MSKKTDTPCEAGMVSQCRAPKTKKCPCCGLWLCHAHQHNQKEANNVSIDNV